MASPPAGKRRMDTDLLKLLEKKHEVEVASSGSDLRVKFHGPPESPYVGGVWQVRILLPENYPFRSPSVGFVNKMFHPNVDLVSGSVCLDVINQSWSALYDLVNVIEIFLPQLLLYPNPRDPLNGEAAALFLYKPPEFKKRVEQYVQLYASLETFARVDSEGDDSEEQVDVEVEVEVEVEVNVEATVQAEEEPKPEVRPDLDSSSSSESSLSEFSEADL